MAIKEYAYNANVKLSDHFVTSEFRCKCGGTHNTKIESDLITKLESIHKKLNCSKIIINSGYRCSSHDKAVGGNGYGMHTTGKAADIVCYNQSGQRISSKLVSCAAQDIGFGGIANIDSTYTATHVDVRDVKNKWYGNEVITTAYSVTNDFYSYYGIAKIADNSVDKATLNKELQTILNSKGAKLVVDGIVGDKTLAEVKKYTINLGDKGELTKWVQKKLNSLGYNCGMEDGIAGDKTMIAISNFQSNNGLGIGYLGGKDFDILLK